MYIQRERESAHVWSHDCKFSDYNELEELHYSHEKLHKLAALPDLYANFTRPYKFTHTLWRVGNVQRFQVQRCVSNVDFFRLHVVINYDNNNINNNKHL